MWEVGLEEIPQSRDDIFFGTTNLYFSRAKLSLRFPSHIKPIKMIISGEYKDLVRSIYPFNKPEEGWCWPAEIL